MKERYVNDCVCERVVMEICMSRNFLAWFTYWYNMWALSSKDSLSSFTQIINTQQNLNITPILTTSKYTYSQLRIDIVVIAVNSVWHLNFSNQGVVWTWDRNLKH